MFVGSVNQQLRKPFQKKKIIAAILALIAKEKSNNRLKDQPRFAELSERFYNKDGSHYIYHYLNLNSIKLNVQCSINNSSSLKYQESDL